MPKYNYVAMDTRGKETKGSLDAGDQNQAIRSIREMGLFPVKVVEDKDAGKTAAASAINSGQNI